MKDDPSEGIGEIRQLLSRLLSGEFPEVRTELIAQAGSLTVVDAEARDLALAEMRTIELVPSAGLNARLNSVRMLLGASFRVAIDRAGSPEEAFRTAVESIAGQKDAMARLELMATYLRSHPVREERLKQALGSRGVEDSERVVAALSESRIQRTAAALEAEAFARARERQADSTLW